MSPHLSIREEQLKAFSEWLANEFEAEMFLHLRSNFPEQTEDLSETELRELIRAGIETAEGYGVETADAVPSYLEFMLILGRHFDVHPQTAWAGEILRHETLDGKAKVDAIEEHLISHSSQGT